MEEKIIIKSDCYNFKKYRNALLITIGIMLVLSLFEPYTIEMLDWIFISPLNWISEMVSLSIFFDLALISLVLGGIFYFWLRRMELVVSDKRVYGRAAFGRQVDLPIDSITAIGKGIIKGIAITTASGAIKFRCIKNRDEIYEVISKLLMARQEVKVLEIKTNSVDDLKKYKELLDSCVITQEDFDAKKKQILGG